MSRRWTICAATFALVAASIVGSAVAATLAMAHGASQSLRIPFRALCHGIASHSLTLAGTPMPLCARCSGIYLGMLAGIATARFIRPAIVRMTKSSVIVFALPMLIDGGTQALGIRTSTNELRLVTGLLAGFAFLLFVMQQLDDDDREISADAMEPFDNASKPHSNR